MWLMQINVEKSRNKQIISIAIASNGLKWIGWCESLNLVIDKFVAIYFIISKPTGKLLHQGIWVTGVPSQVRIVLVLHKIYSVGGVMCHCLQIEYSATPFLFGYFRLYILIFLFFFCAAYLAEGLKLGFFFRIFFPLALYSSFGQFPAPSPPTFLVRLDLRKLNK